MTVRGRINWMRVLMVLGLGILVVIMIDTFFATQTKAAPLVPVRTWLFHSAHGYSDANDSPFIASIWHVVGLLLFSLGLGLIWWGRTRPMLLAMLVVMASLVFLTPPMAMVCACVAVASIPVAVFQAVVNRRFTPGGLITTLKVGAMAFAMLVTLLQSQPFMLGMVLSGPAAYSLVVMFLAAFYLCAKLIPRTLRDPERLPDYAIRSRVRGVTLIELLIVIAIIAISAPMFLKANMIAMQHSRRAAEARQATMQVRSELDRIRAGSTKLEPGVYTQAAEGSSLPMQVEVSAPRADGLTSVTLRMTIGRPLMPQTLAFDALIAGGES